MINNAARDRGEYVRGKKDTARHVYEAAQKVANDNSKKKALLETHRKKAAAIAKKDREDKVRHKAEYAKLEQDRKDQLAKLKQKKKDDIEWEKQGIRNRFRPQWEKQHFDQQAKLAAFEKNETTLKGRMKNALELVQWRNLFGRHPGEQTTLSKAFGILSSEGARREALERQFKKQEQQLKKEQADKIKAAANAAKLKWEKKIADSRSVFTQQRNDLILKHRLERSKTKAEWKGHDKTQRKEWKNLAEKYPVSDRQKRIEELRKQFDAAKENRLNLGEGKDGGISY